MDFVIFGVGLGATLVLLGWLWRTVGPRLRYRAADDSVLSGADLVARISWRRFCRSGGALWVMGGFLLVLAAYVSLLLGLSDHTGAIVVVASALAVLAAVILWLVAYLHRFGVIGLVPKREPVVVPAATQTPARPGRSIPGLRRKPEPVAANPAVLGPAVPAGIATPVATASTDEQAGSERSEKRTNGETPAAVTDVERTEAEAEPGPTVIGAAHRAGKRPEAGNEPSGRKPPLLINGQHLARGSASPAEATGPDTQSPSDRGTGEAASADAPDLTATEGDRDESDHDSPAIKNGSATAAGQSETGPNRANPRVGSEAFRASLVRQAEHLSRAATRGGSPGARRSSRNTVAAADPAGVEGKDWVRGDGTHTVPDGFPVKGNARSRRYHPVGTPSYDATVAEFYFASPAAAETAGYRLPKSLQETGATAAHEAEHHP